MKFIIGLILLKLSYLIDIETVRKMLDRGLDDVKALQETKQYLYQRSKLELNHQNSIILSYGLNNDTISTQIELPFKIDLQFPDILINMNSRGCLVEDSCEKSSVKEREKAVYQEVSYSYFEAKSFLGVKRIRPGELDVESLKEIPDFHQLPIQFYDNSEQMDYNVLGLSPNSKIWKYWESIYHFPTRRINLSLIYKQDQPFIIFDSAINHAQEILFKVKKTSSSYEFKAKINFKDNEAKMTNQEINVCISNKIDQTFRISEPLFISIKNTLCKNSEDCGKASDLKESPEFFLQLEMNDHNRTDSVFNTTFFVNSLYNIQDENIIWKIDKTSVLEDEAGCQFILEQNFLAEKQLMISNDLDDPENLYIGIKVLEPGEFSKLNFYSFILIIMILLSVSLCTVYIILNNSLNKLLVKENMA